MRKAMSVRVDRIREVGAISQRITAGPGTTSSTDREVQSTFPSQVADLADLTPFNLFVPSCLCVKSSEPSRDNSRLSYQILSDNYHITLDPKIASTALTCRDLRNFPFTLRKTDY